MNVSFKEKVISIALDFLGDGSVKTSDDIAEVVNHKMYSGLPNKSSLACILKQDTRFEMVGKIWVRSVSAIPDSCGMDERGRETTRHRLVSQWKLKGGI